MTQDEARKKLDELRVLIDDVDQRIVALVNERTGVVENIGRVKREAQLPVYEPGREQAVFNHVRSVNPGPLADTEMLHVYERIIDVMRTLQRRDV